MAAATQTRPTSAASDADALDDFPAANVRKPGDFPEAEFKNVPDVPVFAEHETVTRAGKPIKFGLDELSKIVERCNRRIDETGDYAAITIGHTPGPEEAAKGAPQPDVIGYAGPFKIGILGLKDGSKRYAILADEHIYLDDVPRWRKHARRSPEVWLEDRFEEMFLDPIAHLGAEAPRLDMGLLYSAERAGGRHVEKYAAVAAASPSPTSVFIPSNIGPSNRVERRKNAAGDSGFSDAVPVQSSSQRDPSEESPMDGGTPQLVEQIVDAMDRLDWVQWVKGKMQEESAAPGPGAMTPGAVGDVGAGGESGPAPAGVGGERRTPPQAPTPSPAAGPSPAPAPAPPVPSPEVKKNAAGADGSPKVDFPASPAKFGADQVDDDEKREREEYAKLHAKYGADQEIQRYAAMCKKYAAADASGEYQEVPPGGSRDAITIPPGGAEVGKGEVKRNAAGSADGVDVNRPAAGNVDEGNNQPGTGDAAGPTSDGADPYRRPEGRERYAGDAQVLRLERQNRDLQQRLQDQEKRTVESERYARLQDLRGRFAFDVESSVEMAKYGKMNDEQFEGHCQFIETSCRVIPLGSYLPGGDDESGAAAAMAAGRPGAGPIKEKYSRQISDQARDICIAAQQQGKQPDYERVLSDLHAGRQPVI